MRKPDKKNASLITTQMWILIIAQSIYQTVVILVLHFAGKSILNMNGGSIALERDQTNELK